MHLFSARSIPTNFGFVFQAGPIQVADTAATESPLPATTSPIPIAQTAPRHVPAPSSPVHPPVAKRKRLVREQDDDQVWFQKRKRKSTKQEDIDHVLPTGPTELAVDETHQEPPTEKKPAKRKVTKRVLVPRSRKNPPVQPSSEPRKDKPISSPKPQVEALPPAKNKTKTKTPTVIKRKSKQSDILDALLPIHEQQDGLRHHSSQNITNPALPMNAQSVHRPYDKKADNKHVEKIWEQEPHHDLAATPVKEQPDQPPKKKKVVRRVRVPKASTKRAMSMNDNQVAKAADTDIPKAPPPTDNIHVDLFEAAAPTPVTKKASKAPKRIFFNDDSDVDLDQMLNGIAEMAGTKPATKAATSKSSRTTRKKAAS